MTYTYTPRGVCSRKMTVELENGVIKSVSVEGGCNGNLQGISRLVVGMNAQDAIERMKGIHCGPKPTSRPARWPTPLRRPWRLSGHDRGDLLPAALSPDGHGAAI